MDFVRAWLDAPPLLPTLAVMQWGWRLAWALVLAAGVAWVGAGWLGRGRSVAVAAVMLWTLWPGPASPAYWLALAFQSPSLASSLLCALWLWRSAQAAQRRTGQSRLGVGRWLAALGTLLGWVLLGDTLAWWLPSVYAWGFTPAALITALGLLLILVWFGRRSATAQRFGALLALVLTVFVLTRLPSGNLWDALLDPWLWLLLQLALLRALWQRVLH
ncbi:MAG: hypothetical protein PHH58_09055 [Rhodoferax sp.]|nr:hypothetical protein [Rhodoferax sp.]